MELSPFVFFALILFSALIVMAALKILRAPTVPAYFIAGILVGPNGLGILYTSEAAHFAGELGIVLLLFTVGLKFSISSLYTIRNYVFLLGSAQVGLTALVFAVLSWFFVADIFIASLIGFVAAMSSTALVSQLLLERNAVASPTGRRSIAVLLLQDIAVIPLIIIYSAEKSEHSLLMATLLLAGKTILLFAIMLVVAPKITRGWLNWAARYGDNELFIFNLVAIITLFSMLTGISGLSYVLGAFIAGILIAETFHRYRVEQIIEPFRQLFLGFFFITLGILIDPYVLLDNAVLIFLLTALVLIIKLPIIYGCVRMAKAHRLTAFRTAFLLSGTGEFGFVLLALAKQSDILSNDLFQLLAPVNMLAMIFVPLFWNKSENMLRRLFPDDWQHDSERMKQSLHSTQSLNNHIIICGFGRTGQALAGILRTLGNKNFITLEEDYTILDAAGNAEQVVYGSGERGDSLLSAGIMRAQVLIVTYSEPVAAALSIQNARRHNSSLCIIAKATTAKQAENLRVAGADHVMVEAHEAGLLLAEKALRHLNDDHSLRMFPHALEVARSGQNPLLKGEYVSTSGSGDDDNTSSRYLLGCRVSSEAPELMLQDFPQRLEVVAWRRNGNDMPLTEKSTPLEFDDELVLFGTSSELEEAKELLQI